MDCRSGVCICIDFSLSATTMRFPCRTVRIVIGTTTRTLPLGNTSLMFICHSFDKGLHPGCFDFIGDLIFLQYYFFKEFRKEPVQLLRIGLFPKCVIKILSQLLDHDSGSGSDALLEKCRFKNLFCLIPNCIFYGSRTDFSHGATFFSPLAVLVAVVIIVPLFSFGGRLFKIERDFIVHEYCFGYSENTPVIALEQCDVYDEEYALTEDVYRPMEKLNMYGDMDCRDWIYNAICWWEKELSNLCAKIL